jgi:hypothetical protein
MAAARFARPFFSRTFSGILSGLFLQFLIVSSSYWSYLARSGRFCLFAFTRFCLFDPPETGTST